MKPRDALALFFAMSFPTLLSWLNFMVLPNLAGADRNNPWLQAAFGVGKAIQFSFPLIYLAIFEPAQLRPSRPTLRGAGLALAFGLVVGFAILGLYFLGLKGTKMFAIASDRVHHWLTQFNLISAKSFLLMAIFIAVIHSLWEEFYWRWFVFGRLRPWLPWPGAAMIAGLAFMAHHVVVLDFYLPGYFWIAVVPFSLCVAVGGIVWAWIYQRSESLYTTWLSHCLVDLAIMIVGYDLLISAGIP